MSRDRERDRSLPAKAAARARARRAGRELETRVRLLESALKLFAERGFKQVTVRDISQHARANLAAVSYHFGDKLGLYSAIIDQAIAAMRAMTESSARAGAALSPEDRLRQYVRSFLPRMAKLEGQAAFIHKVVRHEMAEPTPAARRVIERGIKPRLEYLSEVVAELIGCDKDDERVRSCVLSIQAQCLFFVRGPARAPLFEAWMPQSEAEIARVAEHVAEFSLAGVRAIARELKRPAGRSN